MNIEVPKTIADWASILGFVWGVIASWFAWRQSDLRKVDRREMAAFLHGLLSGTTGKSPDQIEATRQINDRLTRIDPPKIPRK